MALEGHMNAALQPARRSEQVKRGKLLLLSCSPATCCNPRLTAASFAGLVWNNMHQDRWFDRLPEAADMHPEEPASAKGSGGGAEWELADTDLTRLQAAAKRMARGLALRVKGPDGW